MLLSMLMAQAWSIMITLNNYLRESSGEFPANKDKMVDLPTPCPPITPMTRKSVWSTNICNIYSLNNFWKNWWLDFVCTYTCTWFFQLFQSICSKDQHFSQATYTYIWMNNVKKTSCIQFNITFYKMYTTIALTTLYLTSIPVSIQFWLSSTSLTGCIISGGKASLLWLEPVKLLCFRSVILLVKQVYYN